MSMIINSDDWPLVSVLFITFDRIETLEPTVHSFISNTDYPRERLQLVVADDASRDEVQERIRDLPFDTFVLSQRNGGIGRNTNLGLAACAGSYVLQLQDDWLCEGPQDYLKRAVRSLDAIEDVGLLLLKQHPGQLPVREDLASAGDTVRIFDHALERTIRFVGENAYSDWPHLKKRTFIDTAGPYAEHLRMSDTELDYARKVNAQTRYYVAQIMGLDVFRHIGGDLSHNPGSLRAEISGKVARFPGGRAILSILRSAEAAITRSGWRAS